jgi:hypothetical protein
MSDPIVVLVFVLATDGSDFPTEPMAVAARELLGAEVAVLAEGTAAMPDDARAAALADRVHAAAVVELRWSDALHERVAMRVRLARTRSWSDRELAFGRADLPPERARTLGFAFASMLQPFAAEPTPAPSGWEPPALPWSPPAVVVALERRAPAISPPAWSIDLGVAAAALGGAAGGGSASLRARVSPIVDLRWTGTLLFAPANTTLASLDAGVQLHLWAPEQIPFVFELAALAGVTRRAASHNGSTVEQWSPLAEANANLVWLVSPRAAPFLALGAATSFGRATVLVGNDVVMTLPAIWPQTTLGVRIGL